MLTINTLWNDLVMYTSIISLQLRAHLSEVILDQIPSLCDMQRYLENLAMMDPPAAKTGLVLEQVRYIMG